MRAALRINLTGCAEAIATTTDTDEVRFFHAGLTQSGSNGCLP